MLACQACGGPAEEGDKFCGQCGQPMNPFGTSAGLTQKELNASDVRYKLSVVYFKMGKYRQAMETIEKLLGDDPENAAALALCEEIKQRREEVDA